MKGDNRSGGIGAGRDPNDEKVMANSKPAPGGDTNRTIEASMATLNNTAQSPIEAYYSFPSSNVSQQETYTKRAEALSKYLGNKDEVKG